MLEVPFHLPDLTGEEEAAVVSVLRTGWLTSGPKVVELEEEFSHAVGARYAVAVSSCTAAMHLSLLATGVIEPGDEVIVPTMTFAATANVVRHVGAIPVLVDVSPGTLTVEPKAVEEVVTPRTKALIAVDYAGHPAELGGLREVSDRFGLVLVEDAAHSFGAEYRGVQVGSLADATCFSFYATKNITCGDGGMVTTNDGHLADRIRLLRNHGSSKTAWDRHAGSGWEYDIIVPGFKSTLTDLQSAILMEQMRKSEAMQVRRIEIARRYDQALTSLDRLDVLEVKPYVRHARHLYPIVLQSDIDRGQFIGQLYDAGVATSVHFKPLHRMTAYRTYQKFPVADAAFKGLVSLPLYSRMSDEQALLVIEAVRHGAS